VDQKFASATGTDNPLFTILRAQRSLGRARASAWRTPIGSKAGTTNRVAEVDSRLVFKEI